MLGIIENADVPVQIFPHAPSHCIERTVADRFERSLLPVIGVRDGDLRVKLARRLIRKIGHLKSAEMQRFLAVKIGLPERIHDLIRGYLALLLGLRIAFGILNPK